MDNFALQKNRLHGSSFDDAVRVSFSFSTSIFSNEASVVQRAGKRQGGELLMVHVRDIFNLCLGTGQSASRARVIRKRKLYDSCNLLFL